MGKYIVHEIILLSSLHAFFKMSDSEVVLSILALFLAIPCIYQAVFAAIPKYGFLFYVWVCSASEPVLSTSFLYEKSLVVTFIRKVGKRKYSASGEEVDSIFFQIEWDLRASYWDIQNKENANLS